MSEMQLDSRTLRLLWRQWQGAAPNTVGELYPAPLADAQRA